MAAPWATERATARDLDLGMMQGEPILDRVDLETAERTFVED